MINGHKSTLPKTEKYNENSGSGMLKRVRKPLFEKDLMTAGADVMESMTVGVFRDEEALNTACLYIGQMQMFGMDDEITLALYKLNGTMAIDGRARDDAVQAHVGIYFPRHASKEDKKRLEKIQYRNRKEDDEKGPESE